MPNPRPVDVTKALLFFIARASAGVTFVHDVADLFADDLSEEMRLGMASGLTGSCLVGLFAFWTSISDSYSAKDLLPERRLDHVAAVSKAFLFSLARTTACYSVLRYCVLLFTEDNLWLNLSGLSFALLTGSLALGISARESYRHAKNNQTTVAQTLALENEEAELLPQEDVSKLKQRIHELEQSNHQLIEQMKAKDKLHTELLAKNSRFLRESSSNSILSSFSMDANLAENNSGYCIIL
jgi:hypothetical protein